MYIVLMWYLHFQAVLVSCVPVMEPRLCPLSDPLSVLQQILYYLTLELE